MEFLALRIAERWGQEPGWFATLDRATQVQLLAYEEIRSAEEAGQYEKDD